LTLPILIIWTCKDLKEAKRVAKILLEKRLVACASIIPVVESLFHWEGKVDSAEESKVFFKTDSRHFKAVQEQILAECSYEVPEILGLPIEQGNPEYLSWLQNELCYTQ
jgi:periplasmic divalent cation tolerance protein